MTLSKIQRKALETYRKIRTEHPTFSSIFVLNVPRLLKITVLLSLGSYLLFMGDLLIVSTFSIGLLGGILLNSTVYIRNSALVLPALFQVIDWKKLDDLLENESDFGGE